MKEDFLHYVWKFRKFDGNTFFTSNHEKLHIKNPGRHNFDSGPDFFNSKIEIDGQIWAGNVEIHLKSSDWFAHNHQVDPAYNNVILHVVWEHDMEVFNSDGSVIPTFVIKDEVSKTTVDQYRKLFSSHKKWINCENDFSAVDPFVMDNWMERLFFERLERKSLVLQDELSNSQNHWEELLFKILSKNFGLKLNGPSFLSIARSIDFSIINKNRHNPRKLEALLLGQAGLLDPEGADWYSKELKRIYEFDKYKYSLSNDNIIAPKFFRLRPPNFPTIRLAQLAMLYYSRKALFSQVIDIQTTSDFYELFNISAGEYWDTHYNFGISSLKRKKRITKKFINLLIINTVLPIKFSYARQQGKDISDEILRIASDIPSEENIIIKKFNELKPISKTSFHSQALLELKNEYCDKHRCLQCAVGNSILGAKTESVSDPEPLR